MAEPGRTDRRGRVEAAAPPTLLYVVKQVELAVRARLDELVRPGGLTALQYTALTVLERHPDLTSAHLARNSFVTAQSMADMVNTLRSRGLIDRHRDLVDRRRLVLSLTASGRSLLDDYRQAVEDLETEMLSGLSADEAIVLRRGMLACREALQSTRNDFSDAFTPEDQTIRKPVHRSRPVRGSAP